MHTHSSNSSHLNVSFSSEHSGIFTAAHNDDPSQVSYSPAYPPHSAGEGSHCTIEPMRMVNDYGESTIPPATRDLSIVIPVCNEEANLIPLYTELREVLDSLHRNTEILFINDGSTDNSLTILEELACHDTEVKVIDFRRNYGQTAALSAGFASSQGRIVITLDADGQNDPHDIPRLLEKMAEGYDLVNGWRKDRKDRLFSRRLPSIIANRIINRLIEGTGVQLKDFGCTLKAYKRGIVKNISIYGEMHRFIPVFAAWLGVNIAEIPVNHRPRKYGSTKYSLSRVPRVIFDLIVVRFFADGMSRPIQFFGKIARRITELGFSGIFALWLIKHYAHRNISAETLLILTALVCITALQVTLMGLTGELLLHSRMSGKKEQYVVRQIIGG